MDLIVLLMQMLNFEMKSINEKKEKNISLSVRLHTVKRGPVWYLPLFSLELTKAEVTQYSLPMDYE